MDIIRRIERLEARVERLEAQQPVTVDDLTEDELAAIATGGKVTRAEALTEAELERIAAGEPPEESA